MAKNAIYIPLDEEHCKRDNGAGYLLWPFRNIGVLTELLIWDKVGDFFTKFHKSNFYEAELKVVVIFSKHLISFFLVPFPYFLVFQFCSFGDCEGNWFCRVMGWCFVGFSCDCRYFRAWSFGRNVFIGCI